MQFLKFTLLNALLALCMAIVNPLSAQQTITSNLQEKLSTTRSDEMIRINIRLAEQYDTELMNAKTANISDREQKRKLVVEELKSFSQDSQKALMSFLSNQEKSLKVDQIMPLWIVNLINCYATPEVISQIAAMPGVERVDYDQMRQVLEMEMPADDFAPADKTDYNPNIAWNVNLINAPDVWEEGFTGEEIIVAVLDTGVNANHQDLAGRMWTHPDYPNHGYNFVNNNYNTNDDHSHGTHCAGTVAGNGAAGTTTGVAPGATIMALKVLNELGGGTEAGVWAAIQFSADFGAHVMSLSLGWPHSSNPDRSAWRTAMVNAMNAGVVAAVAAGNEGGWGGAAPPAQVRTPGDCPAPWTHPDQIAIGGNSAVVTVGSTTNTDAISDFSSRGPVTWQNIAPFNDYAYNPGTGLIIPDIVAPGSNILSLSNTSNTGYTTKSGTSMATPAVAGLMAVMLSKNPNLTPAQISQILEETALPLSASKSNTFGSGRIDAVAAIAATPFMGVRYVSHTINDSQGNDDGKVNAGETIQLSLTLENPTEEAATNVTMEISSESEFITFTQFTASLGDFAAGEEKNFTDIFSFETSEIIPGNYNIVFVLQATSPDGDGTIWRSTFSETAHAPYLEFLEITVDDSQQGNNNQRLDPGETAILQIPIKNIGQVGSEDISFSVSAGSDWIYVHQEAAIELAGLAPDGVSMVNVQVTALQETPLESMVDINLLAISGLYEFTGSASIIVGKAPVYSLGNIPSTYNSSPSITQLALEPGVLTVSIPQGAVITGVDVEYNITSRQGAWMSEQRSYLRCISQGGIVEDSLRLGPLTNSAGTHTYNRTGLNIANNVTGGGDIDFELHVFRTWGGSGSDTLYTFVPNNTWKVIVHYQLSNHDVTFKVKNQLGETVQNATIEIGGETKQTNENGEVDFTLYAGSHLYNISAPKHRTASAQVVFIAGSGLVELPIQRVYGVAFNLTDPLGNAIINPVITINDEVIDGTEKEDLENGMYNYLIVADGFARISNALFMNNQDVVIALSLYPAYNVTFNVAGQWGESLPDAVISINEHTYEAGVFEIIELFPGEYSYTVEAAYYAANSGVFAISNNHMDINITLNADGTGVDEFITDGISLYPNPATQQVTVMFDAHAGRTYSLLLVNHLGQVVKSLEINNTDGQAKSDINLHGLQSGIYMIRIDNGTNVLNQKLIIQ